MTTCTSTTTSTIAGIAIPDSTLAKDATAFVREIESDLLYDHSLRVFVFGSLQGQRRGLTYDPELLYVGAMFHDVGLVEGHRSPHDRFEVDGANAAREFLEQRGIPADAVRSSGTRSRCTQPQAFPSTGSPKSRS
jgi:HD superfamily phosphodiesterase